LAVVVAIGAAALVLWGRINSAWLVIVGALLGLLRTLLS
jgi:hypothetical protein